jgi:hypothetical protein
MPAKKRNNQPIFIGVAWPYANGSLHLGHVAGLIGADFLARYYRLKSQPVLMVSGSDCHGTPIEVRAEQEKTTPQKIADKYDKEFHSTLIKGLGFSYDLFTKTANPFHYNLVQKYFLYSTRVLFTKKLKACLIVIKISVFYLTDILKGSARSATLFPPAVISATTAVPFWMLRIWLTRVARSAVKNQFGKIPSIFF